MKKILIIYPHWPPSNLAGVHRARLISNFLPGLGWKPVVLTVHPDYYEEEPDWELLKTVSPETEVIHVKAYRVSKPRIIGDIGLRAFFQLKREALKILKSNQIDFIWIPIPSFYTALLGRILHNKTGVPYGIDYIDPWVRDISNRKNLRSVLSIMLARILEPWAIRKAALISGVAEAYFLPAIARNFKKTRPVQVAMPYGFDPADHKVIIENLPTPWDEYPGCIPYVYAGAFLPLSGLFIDGLFLSISSLKEEGNFNEKIKLFFLGTGNYSHKSITAYARDHGIENHVVEIRDRFPYLHILNFLTLAKGVLLIGSTEKHYTASKTFQALLSKRPVFGIMHALSSATAVLKECNADSYLVGFEENIEKSGFHETIKTTFRNFLKENLSYNPNYRILEKYSSEESARALTGGIDKLLQEPFV